MWCIYINIYIYIRTHYPDWNIVSPLRAHPHLTSALRTGLRVIIQITGHNPCFFHPFILLCSNHWFFEYMQVLWRQVPETCIYTYLKQHFRNQKVFDMSLENQLVVCLLNPAKCISLSWQHLAMLFSQIVCPCIANIQFFLWKSLFCQRGGPYGLANTQMWINIYILLYTHNTGYVYYTQFTYIYIYVVLQHYIILLCIKIIQYI